MDRQWQRQLQRVDPVSLVFGLVFVAAGLIVLLGGSLLDDGKLLVPVALISLGAALFASSSGGPGEDGPGDQIGAESREDR